MNLDLANIAETRAQFSSWLARQPEHVQVYGRCIESNLRIASTSQFEKDREAAIARIPFNMRWLKRALEGKQCELSTRNDR